MVSESDNIILLRTKLHRPQAPGDYLHRPELIKKLETILGPPLILVSAPAGYAKSTLVSNWLEECGKSADQRAQIELFVGLTKLICGQKDAAIETLSTWIETLPLMQITTRERKDRFIVTCMTGQVMDQSELTGMLDFLAEMHLPILKVENLDH